MREAQKKSKSPMIRSQPQARAATAARRKSLPSLIQAAAQNHAAGRLVEAGDVYRQILEINPDHADVLHLFGVLSGQRGNPDAGLELISRAIALNPNAAPYRASLAGLLKSLGRFDEAIAAYREALKLNPATADVHTNLGVALRANGELAAANSEFREAIRLQPDLAEAWNNLGNGLVASGDFDEAIGACQKAIALKPNLAEAFHNLGTALAGKGRADEAVAVYRRTIQLAPTYADAHNNLGNVLRSKGQIDEAIAEYKIAIELRPNYAEACNNLGVAQWEAGHNDEAIAAIMKAIELRPEFPEACNSLGNILKDRGDLDGAMNAYQRALELSPNYAEAMSNLAVVLKDQARHDEAVELARRSIEIRPDHAAHGNLIYLLHFHPDADPQAILREQMKWDRLHAEPLRRNVAPHANDRDGNRRLRVGYIGPYFRKHVVGLNIVPLLREHDHERFEIFCYSDVAREDAVTEECRAGADHWRSIVGFTDSQAAELIRADGIDILVDLALHLAGNRLLVLARKPAPVQVTFAGYPAGTGLKAIDYRITDSYLDPVGGDVSCYAEKSIRLPHSFWCYEGSGEPEVGPLPAGKNGFVTFGCLNNFCKVNDRVLELWTLVLKSVSDSCLIVLTPEGIARQRVLERLGGLGVASERVQFANHQPRERYLDLYNQIDIGLDTFPYNGHSTSLDSLWMGVPVVTLAGKSSVARAGVSQLSNLGLTELIARDSGEYVRIATGLAADLNRLGLLRAGLRERMKRSPIMDARGFARGMESAYRTMWVEWVSTTR
jgi:predicted O-linked N-acetylglucosamine transferase (SPINDLY family)